MKFSLLDRLIDLEPSNSNEPVQLRNMNYTRARGALGRDLENLLNTKCFTSAIPEACRLLRRSVYLYGLPDFTSKNPASPAVRSELRLEIERAIRLFEPRMVNVSVRVEESEERERRLRFRITALLLLEKGAEPISFDTYFDINRGEYLVAK